MIRLSLTPYVVALVGTGQQRLVLLTPLLEGFSNLFISIAAGYRFGAIGVAVGTLFGSIVVLLGSIFYNMPRTTDIRFSRVDYVREGFLRPAVCAVPGLLFVCLVRAFPEAGQTLIAIAAVIALLTTLACVWRYGLVVSERSKLRPLLVFAEGTGGS
jgi:O-antigen/teichoic acid export membrane protein